MSNQMVLVIKNVFLRPNRVLFYFSSLAFFPFPLPTHWSFSETIWECQKSIHYLVATEKQWTNQCTVTCWRSDFWWSEVMGNPFPCTLLGGYKCFVYQHLHLLKQLFMQIVLQFDFQTCSNQWVAKNTWTNYSLFVLIKAIKFMVGILKRRKICQANNFYNIYCSQTVYIALMFCLWES